MDELKPMEQRNEPTTVEIVRAIRLCEEGEINCTKCPFANKSCGDLNLLAADRLEAQEQTIAALTARAESAERERDAAIKALSEYEDALYPTAEDVMRDLNTL